MHGFEKLAAPTLKTPGLKVLYNVNIALLYVYLVDGLARVKLAASIEVLALTMSSANSAVLTVVAAEVPGSFWMLCVPRVNMMSSLESVMSVVHVSMYNC